MLGNLFRALGLCFALVFVTFSTSTALAGEDGAATGELDLAALMNLDDRVTSARIARSISEAAIITVISRDKIVTDLRDCGGGTWGFARLLFARTIFYQIPAYGCCGELRGGSRLIKVMVNGHPVSFRSETTNWLNGPIPMDAIDRIEVIRGPGSALWREHISRCGKHYHPRTRSFDGASFRYTVIGSTGISVRACLPQQAIWDRWISFSLTSKTRLTE